MLSGWEGGTEVGQQGLDIVHKNSPQLTGEDPQAKLGEIKLALG